MRIHLQKPEHWPNALIHIWDIGPCERQTEWPGQPMEHAVDGSYYFDLEDSPTVAFVLNGGDGGYQSEDLFSDSNECWFDGAELWATPREADRGLEFPGGRRKAVVMSFDDGVVQDERLIAIFDRYGISGTFHLNSGLMNDPMRVSAERVAQVYRSHEVSVHSVTHPFLNVATREQLEAEILADRDRLAALTGTVPRGLSYPFGSYNLDLLRLMNSWGLIYGRVVAQKNDFSLPADLRRWRGTCHHRNAQWFASEFLTRQSSEAELLLIWGHSWEFDSGEPNSNWDYIERVCQLLSSSEDLWFATAAEFASLLIEYRGRAATR